MPRIGLSLMERENKFMNTNSPFRLVKRNESRMEEAE